MRYHVELRPCDGKGGYFEEHFEFETWQDAMRFALSRDNDHTLHSVLDYEDRDHDPIDITP